MKGNDFGAFLGALDQAKSEVVTDQTASGAVLDLLRQHTEAIPVTDLLTSTPTSIGALARTLETLKEAKLVDMFQSGNNETVALTEVGRQVANMKVKL